MAGKGAGRGSGGERGFCLWVRVKPRASRDAVAGWMEDGCLGVQIKALPEGGAANRSCVALLARVLGVRRVDVTLERGHTGRRKRFRVTGISPEAARARIDAG